MSGTNYGTVLLAGASGYLGSLTAAGLLARTRCRIVAPIRSGTSKESLIEKIKSELAVDIPASEIDFDRLIILDLPPVHEISSLSDSVRKLGVEEIIHCAGSVDYFDSARLKEVNVDLTSQLIALGKMQGVKRFIYLSTAFSCGFVKGLVREALHATPETDPTEYTQSKREAEALVSNSFLPFLIIRPSVVVGDSRNGRYSGKPYGLYQLWSAFERFLCDRYRPVLHFIAPTVKLQIIHQDAYKDAFMAAYDQLADNSIIHLTSKHDSLPTVREVTELWNRMCTRAREIHYYDRLSDVPKNGLDRRTKMWLEFTSVNSDIAKHPWQFDNTMLNRLRANGLQFKDATLDTVRICQEHFFAQSPRLQAFLAKSEQQLAASLQGSEPGMMTRIM